MNNIPSHLHEIYQQLGEIGLYLCGPILDCTQEEMHGWRDRMTQLLSTYNVKIHDPSKRDYTGVLSNAVTFEDVEKIDQEIVEKDEDEITASQSVIAYLPTPSAGSSMEIYLAWNMKKVVITIVPNRMKTSAWVRRHSTFIVESFAEVLPILRNQFPRALE